MDPQSCRRHLKYSLYLIVAGLGTLIVWCHDAGTPLNVFGPTLLTALALLYLCTFFIALRVLGVVLRLIY